ncbi:MAG: DUF3143 domain-containing protein [Mastigocoleus sp. MO_167.B18]|uniref:DUF3143 domain-containing protein n=1 Tax=Mastigocoleus sp. MO_188.B34 TaxID=3036635 RepID=UPI002602CD00|nr:DUF3143 domain-containing protein [Mastigocoleus sp. MO_188.B34]MDJ0693151.1 DUF3143 domain-containing protein [Mastigocoleus sp. MO_188.B34]MDJ0774164.1 DUF3143 domain-containing protein [Mastigocoleus sp. MO_167.B18]
MDLPVPETPLYNHTLPQIEQWLKQQGCEQDKTELEHWQLKRPAWEAELWLDIEQIIVKYIQAGEKGQDIQRSFKYSLSRRDIEEAVFSGP